MENQIKIDVAHVLKTRAPKTKVPRFVVNYLRRIVHEDEFNQFFSENPGLKNLEFIEAAFKYLGMSVSIEGKENLPPKDGSYIFACNHPLVDSTVLRRDILLVKNMMVKYDFSRMTC